MPYRRTDKETTSLDLEWNFILIKSMSTAGREVDKDLNQSD